MFEPVTIITGFLTMWAQLNNYGIDTEKYPHLKNIRVKRSPYLQDNTDYNPKTEFKDSIIMKNIYSVRSKRQNYANNLQNDYVTTIIPLANYPKGSPYYSQNTNGIPYYYNAYNGNNRVYYQNNAYNVNNNGQNQYNSKLVLKPNGGTDNTNVNNNTLLNNGNNNGLNNNGLNNGNNNGKPKRERIYNGTILSSSFMGSSWCPEFLHSVKIGGSNVCVPDDDDYK